MLQLQFSHSCSVHERLYLASPKPSISVHLYVYAAFQEHGPASIRVFKSTDLLQLEFSQGQHAGWKGHSLIYPLPGVPLGGACCICDFQEEQEVVTNLEQEALYCRRLVNGCDIPDPRYDAWKVCVTRHVVQMFIQIGASYVCSFLLRQSMSPLQHHHPHQHKQRYASIIHA